MRRQPATRRGEGPHRMPAAHLDLGLRLQDCEKQVCLSFKLCHLWGFVTTAQADWAYLKGIFTSKDTGYLAGESAQGFLLSREVNLGM